MIYEQEDYDALLKGGIDAHLAQHIAHLFIRDPVSLFSEKIHQDNTKDSDHFEVSVGVEENGNKKCFINYEANFL